MIQVNLHKPDVLDVNINFPSQWDELSSEEILELAKQIIANHENPNFSKAFLLIGFLDSRAKQQKVKLPKKWKDELDVEQLVINGFPLLDFIFGENLLTNPPFKKLTVYGTRSNEVLAPKEGLHSITSGQFEEAEPLYLDFIQNKKIENLSLLAAIFWLPAHTKFQKKDKDGIIETHDYNRWAKLFAKLDEATLYSIFIWYVGCKNMLPKFFPTLHEPSTEPSSNTNPAMIVTNCIHAGAGEKNGSRTDIRLMRLVEFMHDMELEAIKAKQLKEQAANNG